MMRVTQLNVDLTQAIVADVHQLYANLGSKIPDSLRLIAVDGVGGAGKSTLGAQLASAYDGVHVDLDSFLNKGQDKFFDALRVDELNETLSKCNSLVVVSGICVLHVLEAVGRRLDLLIYVKRMAPWGWADADEIEGSGLEDMAEALQTRIEVWPFQVEVRDYHRKYCPHRRAEIILERYDTS